MKTLIVAYQGKVRFIVTNHPEYRFQKLQEQSPVELRLFGVTDVKAKDIKAAYAHLRLVEWYKLTDDFEQFLSEIVI